MRIVTTPMVSALLVMTLAITSSAQTPAMAVKSDKFKTQLPLKAKGKLIAKPKKSSRIPPPPSINSVIARRGSQARTKIQDLTLGRDETDKPDLAGHRVDFYPSTRSLSDSQTPASRPGKGGNH